MITNQKNCSKISSNPRNAGNKHKTTKVPNKSLESWTVRSILMRIFKEMGIFSVSLSPSSPLAFSSPKVTHFPLFRFGFQLSIQSILCFCAFSLKRESTAFTLFYLECSCCSENCLRCNEPFTTREEFFCCSKQSLPWLHFFMILERFLLPFWHSSLVSSLHEKQTKTT